MCARHQSRASPSPLAPSTTETLACAYAYSMPQPRQPAPVFTRARHQSRASRHLCPLSRFPPNNLDRNIRNQLVRHPVIHHPEKSIRRLLPKNMRLLANRRQRRSPKASDRDTSCPTTQTSSGTLTPRPCSASRAPIASQSAWQNTPSNLCPDSMRSHVSSYPRSNEVTADDRTSSGLSSTPAVHSSSTKPCVRILVMGESSRA